MKPTLREIWEMHSSVYACRRPAKTCRSLPYYYAHALTNFKIQGTGNASLEMLKVGILITQSSTNQQSSCCSTHEALQRQYDMQMLRKFRATVSFFTVISSVIIKAPPIWMPRFLITRRDSTDAGNRAGLDGWYVCPAETEPLTLTAECAAA